MKDEYGSIDLVKLFALIKTPSVLMLEQGSLASDYDLSQERVAEVWRVMCEVMLYLELQRDE